MIEPKRLQRRSRLITHGQSIKEIIHLSYAGVFIKCYWRYNHTNICCRTCISVWVLANHRIKYGTCVFTPHHGWSLRFLDSNDVARAWDRYLDHDSSLVNLALIALSIPLVWIQSLMCYFCLIRDYNEKDA